MVLEKQFRNLDEQIEILKNKGLTIDDEDYAKEILLRENYFFIMGYRHLFLKDDTSRTYIEGATFEELYSMFLFDRTIRNILFKNILIIENNLKSIISYQLSKMYGYRERDYLRSKNFTNNTEKQRQVNDLIKKIKRQVRVNGKDNTATEHYVSNYGYIPLWILVKVLSFGIVSEMYSILKSSDQKDIAEVYGITVENMLGYLPVLANYRNLCAHEEILYDYKTQKEIDDTIYHKMLNIKKENNEYIYGKNDILALIIIIKQMLKDEEFTNMMYEIGNAIETLSYNLKSIKIEKVLSILGLPNNWDQLINVERNDKNE